MTGTDVDDNGSDVIAIDIDQWMDESSRQNCKEPVTWEDASAMHPLNVLRVLGTTDNHMTGEPFSVLHANAVLHV